MFSSKYMGINKKNKTTTFEKCRIDNLTKQLHQINKIQLHQILNHLHHQVSVLAEYYNLFNSKYMSFIYLTLTPKSPLIQILSMSSVSEDSLSEDTSKFRFCFNSTTLSLLSPSSSSLSVSSAPTKTIPELDGWLADLISSKA